MTAHKDWLDQISQAAEDAAHIFPSMAACEAALESGYGTSALAQKGLNLFGTKQHHPPVYETLTLPTHEYLHGEWVVVGANWVKYPSHQAAFQDRMATLHRLAAAYPHYAAALAAPDATTYITEISKSWSTDPNRADKVLQIHADYMGDL